MIVIHDLHQRVSKSRDFSAVFDFLYEMCGVHMGSNIVEQNVYKIRLIDREIDQIMPKIHVFILLRKKKDHPSKDTTIHSQSYVNALRHAKNVTCILDVSHVPKRSRFSDVSMYS